MNAGVDRSSAEVYFLTSIHITMGIVVGIVESGGHRLITHILIVQD